MGFTEAIRSGFDNYVTFGGRASRPAYWWWVLFGILVSLVTRGLDGLVGSNIVRTNQYGTEVSVGIITSLVGLALLLPSIAVLVRRLHDTDQFVGPVHALRVDVGGRIVERHHEVESGGRWSRQP